MPSTLYVVATPIGNLTDITLRALEVLRHVHLIAAEDTRITERLLRRYDIPTPTTAYHQHSAGRKASQLIQILKENKDIALVSDAGTPGISDPGHEIISLAIESNIPVVVVPGPNAAITALVASGLPTRRFTFEGFPPRRSGDRRAFFTALADEPRTMVFYESPHRLVRTLQDMQDIWGDRRIAVIREATKVFEEIYRGSITDAIKRFTETKPKGEICIVVGGSAEHPDSSPNQAKSALVRLLNAGISERDAVKAITAMYPIRKRDAYALALELRHEKQQV